MMKAALSRLCTPSGRNSSLPLPPNKKLIIFLLVMITSHTNDNANQQ